MQKGEGKEQASARQHCHTQHISDDFSGCLAEGTKKRCVWAILFGDDYLCIHPRHREFH